MNKEQEAKFEAFDAMTMPQSKNPKDDRRRIWQACCNANGINTEEPMETNAAPEWVIEMMRMGKAVRCNVGEGELPSPIEVDIIGYRIKEKARYRSTTGTWWEHAEPIPAWQPQDGEAVFVLKGTDWDVHVARFSHVDEYNMIRVIMREGNEHGFSRSLVKPFDASKIGKPWSEI
jgi:hypothetical protein